MTSPDFWLAASSLAGRVHFPALRALLSRPGGAPRSASLLQAGLSPAQAQLLSQPPPAQTSQSMLTMLDPGWPQALENAPKAPAVLFYRGDPSLLLAPAVAIVGSRRCSPTGTRMAQRLARTVADRGGVVVSGLAYGIDEAAHLAAPSRTIAVLGQGLEQALTHRQSQVQARILDQGGLVLSELPPASPATRWTFPQRNRIIAGLAQVTIVVEAARNSGALITARQAMDMGREVLAVPGSPLEPMSEGCLDLISAGAGMARDEKDLAAFLPRPAKERAAASGPQLPEAALRLLQRGADVETLANALGWPTHQASGLLTALELTGQVQRLPGERFALRDDG